PSHRAYRTMQQGFSFDTYKLVRHLESQGFRRGQAVAIMRTVNALLVDSLARLRSTMLTKAAHENETYLAKARLQEFRDELALLRRSETASLKAEAEHTARALETLRTQFADMASSLKADVSMDLNHARAEGREAAAGTDLAIQEARHRLAVRLSGLRARVETMKVASI
ncbi:hypothetical protein CXG81DRAFT_4700, partial [Caulochytrium protostelioides]